MYFRVAPVKSSNADWNTKTYYKCKKWTAAWSSDGTTTTSVKKNWPSVQVYQKLKPNTPDAPTIEISDKTYNVIVSVEYYDRTAVKGLEVQSIQFQKQ